MKKYRIGFHIDIDDAMIIEANSEEEAEEIFCSLNTDEFLDMSGVCIDTDNPSEVDICYIEETEED